MLLGCPVGRPLFMSFATLLSLPRMYSFVYVLVYNAAHIYTRRPHVSINAPNISYFFIKSLHLFYYGSRYAIDICSELPSPHLNVFQRSQTKKKKQQL